MSAGCSVSAPACACRSDARVTVKVTSSPGGTVVATRRATVTDTCKFRFRLSFGKQPGRGRLRAVVAYTGNDALIPARSRALSLRAG